nr:MAG TPA: hypothetical protein [Caudoviricetes sp.]
MHRRMRGVVHGIKRFVENLAIKTENKAVC